jgi:hypothetical protein
VLRIGMDLDHDTVRADNCSSQRHGTYEASHSRGMAWIKNNREMGIRLNQGNHRKIGSVSRGRFKGSYPPFAENDVRVALKKDIFSR